MAKRIVIALGGNALGKNLEEQMQAVKTTASAIADLIEDGHEVVIAHGNGPQVGMIQNAFAAYHKQQAKSDIMPLSMCVAMSQGYIGYDLQNMIGEELDRRGLGIHCATVLTQVAVDPADPAFQHPTKPIGAFMTEEEAKKLAAEKGIEWTTSNPSVAEVFGGSISAKVVSVDPSYKTGEEISVDFSAFVENENGYFVTYTLLSEQGTLSDAGVYTYTPTAAGKVTVQVEATSAFDKLAFTVELNVTDDQQGGDDSSTSDSTVDSSVNDSNVGGSSGTTSGGCGSSIIGLGVTGLTVSAGALAAVMIRKKRED